MTTNQNDAMREAFEKAWQYSLDSYTGNPDANTYGCSHQEAGWLMWQARAQQDKPTALSEEGAVRLLVDGFMQSKNSKGKYPLTPVSDATERRALTRHMPTAYRALMAHLNKFNVTEKM